MNKTIRKQLDQARREYAAARYPGNLAAELLPAPAVRGRVFLGYIGAAAIGAIAAAITMFLVLRPAPASNQSIAKAPTPTTNEVIAVAPDDSNTNVINTSDSELLPVVPVTTLSFPSMPSFPSMAFESDPEDLTTATNKEPV